VIPYSLFTLSICQALFCKPATNSARYPSESSKKKSVRLRNTVLSKPHYTMSAGRRRRT